LVGAPRVRAARAPEEIAVRVRARPPGIARVRRFASLRRRAAARSLGSRCLARPVHGPASPTSSTPGHTTNGDEPMNWDQVEGKWEQLKGRFKQKWGKLTDDDLTQAKGRRDELVGKIQQRHGDTREAAERAVDELVNRL
jgi:uncharacterized protein YjbJ (UPF0337 family)